MKRKQKKQKYIYKPTLKDRMSWWRDDILRVWRMIAYFTTSIFHYSGKLVKDKEFEVKEYLIAYHSEDYHDNCFDEQRFKSLDDAYACYNDWKNRPDALTNEDFVRLNVVVESIGIVELARYR